MNNELKNAVQQLVEKYQQELVKTVQLIDFALANKDSLLVKSMVMVDTDLKLALDSNKKDLLEKNLVTSIRHFAWKEFFSIAQINTSMISIADYNYDSSIKRQLLRGKTELKDFTLENIESLYAVYTAYDESLIVKDLTNLLYRTGDYGKRNTQYKARQTFKGVVSGTYAEAKINSELVGEIVPALIAIEYLQGQGYKPERVTELRQQLLKPVEMDKEITIIEGVAMILKSSGSLELRLDKLIVGLLNDQLTTTA